MNASEFKNGLEQVLVSRGFTHSGEVLRREGQNVETLISFEKGFGHQWCINVGFWLKKICDTLPDTVAATHLYFRLERLFPELRERILVAGALDDAEQPGAYEELIGLFSNEVDFSLRMLGTENGLRIAFKEGKLSKGLVRKEAREYLTTSGRS